MRGDGGINGRGEEEGDKPSKVSRGGGWGWGSGRGRPSEVGRGGGGGGGGVRKGTDHLRLAGGGDQGHLSLTGGGGGGGVIREGDRRPEVGRQGGGGGTDHLRWAWRVEGDHSHGVSVL